MSCVHLNERFCSLYGAVCDVPASMCKYYKHPLGLHPGIDWSTIKEDEVEDMSCIHKVWNCYCKHDEKVLEKPCSPLCKNYCTEETSMKNILNKGPATNVTCKCSYSNDDNDYITLLEKFINNMYPESNRGFFDLDIKTAENRVVEDMLNLGWNDYMIKSAFDKTVSSNQSAYVKNWTRFDAFVTQLNKIPHKPYDNYCSTNFRFVLTLILGYLGKLDSLDIILCHDPKEYFKNKVGVNLLKKPNLSAAVNKTRGYVKESNDSNLAEGMRMVEQWFEDIAKENIPPKELTVADIEKQLGYKIKIVGEDK